jgi:NADH-quinone oxidoreductase subunit A
VRLWLFGLYFGLVIALATMMLAVSYILGQRHSERATGDPYEGGIVAEGSADVRFAVKFYLVAMFFVIFDVESIFIFSWAAAGRDLGWQGYWEVLIFIGILVTTLAYLWRLGALDWNVKRRGQ